MKVSLVDYLLVSFPFKARLSWGSMGYSRHIFIMLKDESGNLGFGEGVLYRTTHLEVLPYMRKKVFPSWQKKNFSDFTVLRQEALDFIPFEPAISFALDTAIWDLEGKQKNKPLYSLLEGSNGSVEITEEIFLENGQEFDQKLVEIISHGTRNIKLKVGKNLKSDLSNVRKIYDVGKGNISIKLDANQAYSYSEALEMASEGKKWGVKLFEEPIQPDNKLLKKLGDETGIPVMLDESILNIADLKSAIACRCFSALNVKLTRLGGVSSALEYISLCQKNGINISLGCSEECLFGMASILHLSRKIKSLTGTEGIGGDRLKFPLSPEIFSIRMGSVKVPETAGIGVDETLDQIQEKANKIGGIFYRNNSGRSGIFLAGELSGIWSTRIKNVILKLKN